MSYVAPRFGHPPAALLGHICLCPLQPVDPLSLWKTPPFECRIEDGEFKGRGVDDDKGEVMQSPKPVCVSLSARLLKLRFLHSRAVACPGSNTRTVISNSMAECVCHACMQVACCSPYMQSRPCSMPQAACQSMSRWARLTALLDGGQPCAESSLCQKPACTPYRSWVGYAAFMLLHAGPPAER